MKKNNMLVRAAIRKHGLRQWEIAEVLDMGEVAFSKMLRKELPIAAQEALVEKINSACVKESIKNE